MIAFYLADKSNTLILTTTVWFWNSLHYTKKIITESREDEIQWELVESLPICTDMMDLLVRFLYFW